MKTISILMVSHSHPVIIPETEKNIKYITMKLDENERSTQIRLMKVKDMMLEEAHGYSQKAEEYEAV